MMVQAGEANRDSKIFLRLLQHRNENRPSVQYPLHSFRDILLLVICPWF